VLLFHGWGCGLSRCRLADETGCGGLLGTGSEPQVLWGRGIAPHQRGSSWALLLIVLRRLVVVTGL